jgi:transposase
VPLLHLSWDEIHGILERAVRRGLGRRQTELVSQIGVDEKAFRKGHSYLTVVNDLVRSRVLYVAEDRKQSSLDGFWETLTAEQINGIEAVAIDMWDPYIASTVVHVPNGREKIVFDRFHIMKQMNEAVDAVRKEENRLLMEDDFDILKGTKYLWLFAEENTPEKMAARVAGETLVRQELRARQSPIRVSSVSPGQVDTDFTDVFVGPGEVAPPRGIRQLDAVDVARAVVWILAQPAHVEVHDVQVRPTAQRN